MYGGSGWPQAPWKLWLEAFGSSCRVPHAAKVLQIAARIDVYNFIQTCKFEELWVVFWLVLATISLHFRRLGEYEFGVNFQGDSMVWLAGSRIL